MYNKAETMLSFTYECSVAYQFINIQVEHKYLKTKLRNNSITKNCATLKVKSLTNYWHHFQPMPPAPQG